TLRKQLSTSAVPGKRALSEETSRQMRGLMRLVVKSGTGKKAEAPGYRVGGKTGTAEKQGGGGYRKKALTSSFVGAFPMDAPRYVVLVIIDEPKGNKKTRFYATGGWVAAPSVSRIVSRLAPILGIAPQEEIKEKIKAKNSGAAKLASLRVMSGVAPVKVHGQRIEAQ
ncbi:MAG TPA: hypothetical protein ENI79_02275, partial [Rhodospirillales bacterium]|nr:hypothetical protein [Rhodospirillales bacterium]